MSKFIPWIDDNNLNATQDYTTFVGDSQRQEGFRGGTPASAIRVNTALRQSSLVISALMNVLANDDTTTDFRTDLDTFTTFLNTKLTQKIKTTKVDNAAQSDNATNANNINNLAITRDENGVLKIGDIIIPQKQLLWEGQTEYSNFASVNIGNTVKAGDQIELVGACARGLFNIRGTISAIKDSIGTSDYYSTTNAIVIGTASSEAISYLEFTMLSSGVLRVHGMIRFDSIDDDFTLTKVYKIIE